MNALGKVTAAFVLVILAIGGAVGVYYINTSSVLASQEQTISGLESTVSSLISHQATSTVTSISTRAETTTSVRTTGTLVTQTITRFPNVPWDYVMFMTAPDGGSSGISFGSNFSNAILFDCPNAATGCAVQVYDSMVRTNFSIVAWYPQVNQADEPAWANCSWEAYELPSGQPLAGAGQTFALCIPIGSNAFIVAEQGGGPD